ncbi:MAG: glycosyltransferase family 2 protein [Pyrinomonadaceae bacterium]
MSASSVKQFENDPFLTVAIPHFKHRRYLEVTLASLFVQTYEDFEILISDDCSQDDSSLIIPLVLKESGRPFRYYSQPVNLGYDGNVRFCLRAARGRYVFLLGNDDSLASPNTLENVVAMLHGLGLPDVAFTNYEDWKTGKLVRNALRTTVLGSGALAAITHFRSFSFVSGAIYSQKAAVEHETDRWDNSIYYQIYIACRILAAGGQLGALNLSTVRKDIRISDQTVPNYVSKWANAPRSFQSRHTGLDSVIRVTANAVLPLLKNGEKSASLRRIVAKTLVSSYPFWVVEYRRVANWSFSVGIARGFWPGKLLAEYKLAFYDRLYLWLLYLAVTFVSLLAPISLLTRLHYLLATVFRSHQQSSRATIIL